MPGSPSNKLSTCERQTLSQTLKTILRAKARDPMYCQSRDKQKDL